MIDDEDGCLSFAANNTKAGITQALELGIMSADVAVPAVVNFTR